MPEVDQTAVLYPSNQYNRYSSCLIYPRPSTAFTKLKSAYSCKQASQVSRSKLFFTATTLFATNGRLSPLSMGPKIEREYSL